MKYFGTDGIRGVANKELTPDLAYRAGFAAASVLTKNLSHRCKIFIGRDTRISGNMLECALAAGICAAGADVYFLGVLPTPAVAYLTVKHKADAGVVISASHNPFEHNGIKIFGGNGYKLSDAVEEEIESVIDNMPNELKTDGDIGITVDFKEEGASEYAKHIVSCVKGDLSGIKAIIDCSNGAASGTAELIFKALGVEYHLVHCKPDGVNINENCGSTHIENLSAKVVEGGYDIGIAFDGDADRCLMVDDRGNIIDGDLIMGTLAGYMKKKGTLKGGVVATIMSNLGLHTYLKNHGIDILTTKVGDRYVLEEMVKKGYNIGGEQSGHMILSDYATTGDGELTAVKFLEMLKDTGRKASDITGEIEIYPQIMINVPVPNDRKKTIADREEVKKIAEEIKSVFGDKGRVLIRPSGTEAKVRVMVEGDDIEEVKMFAQKAADTVKAIAE